MSLNPSSPLLCCPDHTQICLSPLLFPPRQQTRSLWWTSSGAETTEGRIWSAGSSQRQTAQSRKSPDPPAAESSVARGHVPGRTCWLHGIRQKHILTFWIPAWSPGRGRLPVFPSAGCESPALRFHLCRNRQWCRRFWWWTGGERWRWLCDPVGPRWNFFRTFLTLTLKSWRENRLH